MERVPRKLLIDIKGICECESAESVSELRLLPFIIMTRVAQIGEDGVAGS